MHVFFQTILTPKKECYSLRTRTVHKSTSSLDDSIPFESPSSVSGASGAGEGGGGILGEEMPEEMQFQEAEGLLDQIKALQVREPGQGD